MAKYDLIVMDPAWSFLDKLRHSDVKRGAEDNYDVLSFDDLLELSIKEISSPNALLAMWCPSVLIPQGLKLMERWNFSFKQIFVWVKNKKEPFKVKKNQELKLDNMLSMGMGHLMRQCHEIALIGINGSGVYKNLQNKSQRSVSFGYNMGHSIKPETLQDRLELMFPSSKKIELFARRQRKNWTCIGNECPGETYGEDIRVSLNKLITKVKAA